jgi:hypothetical protein
MIAVDPYELRARLAPALVIASPWVLVVVAFVQVFASTLLTSSATALIFVALLYAFSFVVRGLGRQIENGLWTSWGGQPSATVLSDTDSTFSAETKSRLRTSLAATLGISGATEASWTNDLHQVQDAFQLVRQHIRQRDQNGLWSVHNAEYGFLRNLLGSWWLLLLNSLLSAGVTGVFWHARGGKNLLMLTVLSLGLGLSAIVGRIFVLPGATRTAAIRYAESAWTSFLANSQSADQATQGRGGA